MVKLNKTEISELTTKFEEGYRLDLVRKTPEELLAAMIGHGYVRDGDYLVKDSIRRPDPTRPGADYKQDENWPMEQARVAIAIAEGSTIQKSLSRTELVTLIDAAHEGVKADARVKQLQNLVADMLSVADPDTSAFKNGVYCLGRAYYDTEVKPYLDGQPAWPYGDDEGGLDRYLEASGVAV